MITYSHYFFCGGGGIGGHSARMGPTPARNASICKSTASFVRVGYYLFKFTLIFWGFHML
jgi:hypothetical protein